MDPQMLNGGKMFQSHFLRHQGTRFFGITVECKGSQTAIDSSSLEGSLEGPMRETHSRSSPACIHNSTQKKVPY